MKVSKIPGLGRFGVFIDDVDFDTITDEEWMEIGRIHTETLVTILRNVNLNIKDYHPRIAKWGYNMSQSVVAMLQKYNKNSMGELREVYDIMPVEDQKYLDHAEKIIAAEAGGNVPINRISGKKDKNGNPIGMFADGELLWHSNESGQLCHGPGVALLGKVGMVGSATGFCTTTDWYEEQTESFRSELDEMIIEHSFTPGRINPGLNKQQDWYMNLSMCPVDSEIPLIIKSPGGIKGLHYSINTIKGIKGMSQTESDKMLDFINKGLFQDKYVYDHWYQENNDLCLFDNTITLHRRLGSTENRLAYRISYDMSLIGTLEDRYLQEPYNTMYRDQLALTRNILKIPANKKQPELA